MDKLQIFKSFQRVCVCFTTFCEPVKASLTTHELLLADGEHASALQHLWVGAAGIDAGQEGLLCHPDGKPLQLAVAQQAGSVQTPVRGEDTGSLTLYYHKWGILDFQEIPRGHPLKAPYCVKLCKNIFFTRVFNCLVL